MAGGQQSDNTLHEGAIGWGIMLIIISIIIWIIWYYFDVQIRDMVRWIRYGEMWVAKVFIDVAELLGIVEKPYEVFYPVSKQYVEWQNGFEHTPEYQAKELTYNHLSLFSALAMHPLKYVICALMGGMAVWTLFRGPNTQYRQVLGLEGLIKRQSEIFPVISPFVEFNPSKQSPRPPGSPVPAELPLFAEALGPEEWLAYNKIPAPDGQLDQEALFKSFRKQLGPFWRGPKKLEPYKQIMLAAFCLKAARKRGDSDAMLGRLAKCWSAKGLDLKKDSKLLKEARAVLANKDLAGNTLALCNQHAYETTVMLRALQTAREEGGVLQSAQFVWLRAHDRNLWYPLNNLGRQSYHMEALGALAHYKCEKRTLRPIPVPKMEDAITTITEYMSGPTARPIPQLDYSGSSKSGVKKAV